MISRAKYGTVLSYRLWVEIRKVDIEIFHCTVYCTMCIEGRHHSWRFFFFLEWRPNSFWFRRLMSFFGEECMFQLATLSGKAPPVCRTKRERKSRFSSTFWEEALLLDGFLQDTDSRYHAINPTVLGKNQTFIPPPSINAASGGMERTDRIEKCHSGLCNSIIFWSKTTSCIHSSRYLYPHTSSQSHTS